MIYLFFERMAKKAILSRKGAFSCAFLALNVDLLGGLCDPAGTMFISCSLLKTNMLRQLQPNGVPNLVPITILYQFEAA
jgi:hypothetical protein